jgi:adenine-specific DNA methylase
MFGSAARRSAKPGTNAFISPRSFGCGCATLSYYIEKSIVFAKILRLRVCSVCQYLLLWQRLVRSPQCGLRSFTLDNLRGTRYGDRHDVGYTRYGDRHDVRYTDHERSTSNAQLSTFNRVTERADGGRNMGTDTEFGRPDRLTRWTCPTAGRTVQAGCGAQIWGQTRCRVRYTDQERST